MTVDFDAISEPVPRRIATGLAKIGLALKTQGWSAAADQGLTPTQGQILSLLAARAPMRPSDLAAELGVTRATTSDAVTALTRKGLVAKAPAADDARAIALSLTDAGRGEAERTAVWPDFLLHAVDTLTPAEQTVFLRSLVKMIRALQERGEISTARMCAACRYFRPNVHDDPERPHHCAYVDAPFGDRHLRLDCPEFEAADAGQAETAWRRFAGTEEG